MSMKLLIFTKIINLLLFLSPSTPAHLHTCTLVNISLNVAATSNTDHVTSTRLCAVYTLFLGGTAFKAWAIYRMEINDVVDLS